MIGYLLAIIPLYIFVYIPISQLLGFSTPSLSSSRYGRDHEHSFNESFIAFEDVNTVCPEHTYTTHILNREPLVLYLEGWLSEREIEHLLEISASEFAPSHVSTGPAQFIDPSIRRSEVATLPRSPTVKCIEARARSLQGWDRQPLPSQSWSLFGAGGRSSAASTRTNTHKDTNDNHDSTQPRQQESGLMIERLKIQKYGPGGHYTHHYDWQGGASGVDRVSSFMVYVDANCTGGGTGFPRLPRPISRNWCRFIECRGEGKDKDEEQQQQLSEAATGGEVAQAQMDGEGVIFKPVRGNAVFWENLRPDGSGYAETWHAGLPVETGTKIGLNIWTWGRF